MVKPQPLNVVDDREICLGCGQPTQDRDCGCPAGTGRARMKTPTKLDKKFAGILTKVKDGSQVPSDQWVCFLIKDNAFAEILPLYLIACRSRHCDPEQIAAVEQLIATATAWRATHPDLCKNPDAAGEKLIP